MRGAILLLISYGQNDQKSLDQNEFDYKKIAEKKIDQNSLHQKNTPAQPCFSQKASAQGKRLDRRAPA